MTVQQATQQLLFQLYHIYEQREARNIADLVMEKITEWKKIDRILYKEVPISAEKETLLQSYIVELLEHRPVQYVLQESWFYGMKFYVDEYVLIPRPETEEMVNWIVNDTRALPQGASRRLLDIGTGSGCIPVALKKHRPALDISSCDISEKALEVARKNAQLQEVSIAFLRADFLNAAERSALPACDILVSNPPYIPSGDKESMRRNVLDYEPHLALFVEKEDPLIFYKAIADYTKSRQENNVVVYVEVHEGLAQEVSALFLENGFQHIELKKDLQGRDRMVKAY